MKSNIKKIFIILLLVICILLVLIFSFYKNHNNNSNTNNLATSPFSIEKIMIYSSAYGQNKNETFQQNNWILDIFQYSDIAIYIKNNNSELTLENSVKNLSLENISIKSKNNSSCSIYYLDAMNFGKPIINKNDIIKKSLEFTVINDKNDDNWAKYNTPVFFTDCSNPITLKYVNNSITKDFAIETDEPISFDGKLLQLAEIPLDNLDATINISIKLQSNANKNYLCNISIPISLKNENSSIYDGKILVEKKYDDLKFKEY